MEKALALFVDAHFLGIRPALVCSLLCFFGANDN